MGERLTACHINAEPRCKRCGSSESINHLLFHCPFARVVWNLSPLAGSFDVSGLTDLRADWSELHAIKCLPPSGVASTPLVPWLLWFLWKARNKYVFENFTGSPADTVSQAIVAAKEWEKAQDSIEKKVSGKTHVSLTRVNAVIRSDAAWTESTNLAGLG